MHDSDREGRTFPYEEERSPYRSQRETEKSFTRLECQRSTGAMRRDSRNFTTLKTNQTKNLHVVKPQEQRQMS